MSVGRARAAGAWLASPLFRRQAADFAWLWLVFKGANAATAARAGLSLFAVRPATEAVAFLFESLALLVFLRRARERVLLANLGLDLPTVLLPFAALHLVLSGLAALL